MTLHQPFFLVSAGLSIPGNRAGKQSKSQFPEEKDLLEEPGKMLVITKLQDRYQNCSSTQAGCPAGQTAVSFLMRERGLVNDYKTCGDLLTQSQRQRA